MVAEATSRRRSRAVGIAAFAIENHALARRNIDDIISAVAIRTQLTSERTMLLSTWSTPTRRAAKKVSPSPTIAATTTPIRRAVR